MSVMIPIIRQEMHNKSKSSSPEIPISNFFYIVPEVYMLINKYGIMSFCKIKSVFTLFYFGFT